MGGTSISVQASTDNSPPASTMWAGLFGAFTAAAVRGPDDVDANSLFLARSVALGFLEEANWPSGVGLWGMNDAALTPEPRTPADPVAWFQVGVSDSAIAAGVLPAQPFLACVESVMARLGTLELHAVEMVLPPQPRWSRSEGARGRLAQGAGWFPPGVGTRVDLSIEGGEAMSSAEAGIVEVVRSIPNHGFACLTSSGSRVGELPHHWGTDAWWGGPPSRRLVLRGTLAEWSLDAVAWAVTLIAHACHRAGVTTPVRVSVRPSPTS